jgi:hypothetical protein
MFVNFYWNLNFLGRFSKNLQISNLMETCPVGTELFREGRLSDGQTDMTKSTAAFRNSAKFLKQLKGKHRNTQGSVSEHGK